MTENTTEYVWTPPEYKFSENPTKRTVLGLSETSGKPAERPNFPRSAKWYVGFTACSRYSGNYIGVRMGRLC